MNEWVGCDWIWGEKWYVGDGAASACRCRHSPPKYHNHRRQSQVVVKQDFEKRQGENMKHKFDIGGNRRAVLFAVCTFEFISIRD